MKVLNIGSMNLDLVYRVDHIVQPGETEASVSMNTFLGGKGMNQSCALAKAGVEVYHGGMIGEDGKMFLPFSHPQCQNNMGTCIDYMSLHFPRNNTYIPHKKGNRLYKCMYI